ncbi:MAG: GspH/FimT family pseudopilin [Colwellia sp.]
MQRSTSNIYKQTSKHKKITARYKSIGLTEKIKGFSLIELLVTIAIAAIILAIALPSLGGFMAQMRVDNRITELQRLLLTTRNTAINTGENAILCILPADHDEDIACQDSNDWTGRIGIISSVDNSLIREREAIKDSDKLTFEHERVTYGPDGQLINDNTGIFSYCTNGYADYSRGVGISQAGRSYLSSDINNDGKNQDRNGNNITCD